MKTVLDIIPGLTALEVLDESATALIQGRIGGAYKAVFTGNAAQDDVDLVLIDLAQFVRYYDTANIDADPVALAAVAHRRSVLEHVLDAIEMQGGKIDGLRLAAFRAPQLYEE